MVNKKIFLKYHQLLQKTNIYPIICLQNSYKLILEGEILQKWYESPKNRHVTFLKQM